MGWCPALMDGGKADVLGPALRSISRAGFHVGRMSMHSPGPFADIHALDAGGPEGDGYPTAGRSWPASECSSPADAGQMLTPWHPSNGGQDGRGYFPDEREDVRVLVKRRCSPSLTPSWGSVRLAWALLRPNAAPPQAASASGRFESRPWP